MPHDPLWYKDAVIYQAHVKSFFDSNNDGVGDFPGLTQKLDYLQALGITCIWLLPFFPSPLKDDGYDIADYTSVHPTYGTLADFKAFVDAAHARSIRVLIELVVNHTSDQHPWFQRARNAPPGSPERDFYVWSDTDTRFPETRIIFTDTERSNWAFDPVARQYYWHRFFSHQPDLNHNNPAVVDAVIDVMKFWLGLGADALRLDAVPYLCVREGTNNENLPETHAVLKRMRRELDAAFPDRMLLAEANQWPADVRDYFGDGDECHMAFHFPLMPRMFMALRQEDRHAVTEILSQTPDLPPTCQWALFLRNHDELTLEMVTDEERDYMYRAYAADPQMRLNVGIRRRLAPLVENSRRRIELLNLLLFSMPGTPIVYYGDELGMGDNIYLGDRNGVRTPMQWNGDRNGGFSRADTARLFAPPISDPVYGYQAINVEALERSPFSLLNWMKRLIALRRQHSVFGRGTIEFLACPNRKVLAYLRRSDEETVLVLANLSRTLQPAEVDLSSCAGMIPHELLGQVDLPRIEPGRPYFVTLGPYAGYWFALHPQPTTLTPTASEPMVQPAVVDELPSMLVGIDWQRLFDSATRQLLEKRAIASFIARQRWFASKSKTVRDTRCIDWTMLRGGATPAFLVIVTLTYTDSSADTYVVPCALVLSDVADRLLAESPGSVICRITGARKGALVDGLLDDGVCDRLLQWAIDGATQRTTRGSVRGVRVNVPTPTEERRWTRAAFDSSNSLAVVNDSWMLKLFRRLDAGPNPEFEVGRALGEAGYDRVPTLRAALTYDSPPEGTSTLAVVQDVVSNQGTGWTMTIDELRRYYERVSARVGRADSEAPLPETQADATSDTGGPPPFFEALEGWYLSLVSTLGRRTGELHRALATAGGDAFTPRPFDVHQRRRVVDGAIAEANRALDLLQSRLSTLPADAQPPAVALLAQRARLAEQLHAVEHVADGGMLMRVHGDFHLGQVLRTEDDFVILDFEGEPSRSIAERRERHSPLKDVAGMLRSFDYAAWAALFAVAPGASVGLERLVPWAHTWRRWVSRTYLAGYVEAMRGTSVLPRGDSLTRVLHALTLQKACYELQYELNNRPEWVRIPLVTLASRLQS